MELFLAEMPVESKLALCLGEQIFNYGLCLDQRPMHTKHMHREKGYDDINKNISINACASRH